MAAKKQPPVDCLFCKIIAGTIPAEHVFKNTTCAAFLDINPVNAGHTLIVPRKHAATIFDADDAALKDMLVVAKKVGRAVMSASGATGINIGINNYAAAGQVVHHLHMHVIPRHEGDGLKHWPHKTYNQGEIQKWAQKIRKFL